MTTTCPEPPLHPMPCGAALREQVPILNQTMRDGRRLAYLDSAATSQKPRCVIDAVQRFYEADNANVHRALHQLAERATLAYEGARDRVARLVNAPHRDGVVFTRGTTEAINLWASSWGRHATRPGDEIVLTEMEHHSNLVPWQMLARERELTLRYVPFLEDGSLDPDAWRNVLTDRTRLVALTHMSNVLGTVNPVADIARQVHDAGAILLLDAAQSVPHRTVDMQALGADVLVFSGHKMMAPTGTGALVTDPARLEPLPPYQSGGEMIERVTLEGTTFAAVPHKFEAGTPHVAGAAGLAEAIRFLTEEVGLEAIHRHEQDLLGYALARLEEVSGVTVMGSAPDRGEVISFEVDGIHPHDLTQFVDREGVALRAGHMCCQPLLDRLGVGALSRASFYAYNDRDDVDQWIEALQAARRFFRV